MRCEVLAIGTELLLGQIVDTNSAWIGEQLAASGVDSFEHRVIGDNQTRIVAARRKLFQTLDELLGAHVAFFCVQNRVVQVFFTREVTENNGFAHARGGGDVLCLRTAKSIACKHLDGDINQLPAAVFAVHARGGRSLLRFGRRGFFSGSGSGGGGLHK